MKSLVHSYFYFFIILAIIAVILACAGRPLNSSYKKIRYIPEEKKQLYISTVYNHTPFKRLGKELRNDLSSYFLTSEEVIFNIDLRVSDLFLEIEIVDYLSNVLAPFATQAKEIRHLINVKVSIKDVITTRPYVSDVSIQASYLQKVEVDETIEDEHEIKKKLFKKVAKNIEHLIRTGNVLINSQFGYEGLEQKGTWLDNNKKLLGIKENPTRYGSLYENQTESFESNRIQKVNQLDKKGFQKY